MLRTRTRYSKSGLAEAHVYERCMSSICHHVSNDSYYGEPFLLAPFQREDVWKPMLACGHMVRDPSAEGGHRFQRRHRRLIIGLPSGYGKTELAAAIILTIATMEPVWNGQYGLVASSLDQVGNLFGKVSTMVALSDTLSEKWEVGKKVLTNRETGARIFVLPNKAAALESWHFNVLVFDELHTYRDDTVWNAGTKGQKVIPNALTIGITTAAASRDGFLWELLGTLRDDPASYIYWLGLDDRDDIDDRAAWDKMLVAPWVRWEDVQDQRRQATSTRHFERYAANRFPQARRAESAFRARDISACLQARGSFSFSRPFMLGVDGAISGDTFAIVGHQMQDGMDLWHEWVFDTPTDSGYYDLDQIEQLIAGIAQRYRCPVGIDPARLLLMAQQLKDDYRLDIMEVAQSNAIMCSACDMVARSVRGHTMALGETPKLAEHLANCLVMEREPYGWRFGSSGHGQGSARIDAAIAAAIAKYMTMMVPERLSFAETDGVWRV